MGINRGPSSFLTQGTFAADYGSAIALRIIRLATASLSRGRHGEWSRWDASDIDGQSREADMRERVSQSVLWRTSLQLLVNRRKTHWMT
jgi:hypothetical protein